MAWTFDSVVDTKQDAFGKWYSRVKVTSPEETKVIHFKFRSQPTGQQITRAVQQWLQFTNNDDSDPGPLLLIIEWARARGYTRNQIRNKLLELLS